MKVIIAGSRGITALATVEDAVVRANFRIIEVVSGRARGVDLLGEQWATMRGIPISIFPANWDLYGRGAGFIRNETMAHYADALIAVWDGRSGGTKHMIDTMTKLGKTVYVYQP